MNIRDRRALKDAARQSLADASYNPQKLILLHTGVILLLSLLLTAVDYLLEQRIGSTGGLGGMGTRSVLTTMQTVLRLTQTFALPFWQMGYVFLTLKLCRGEPVSPKTLLQGFRCLGSVLRLELLQLILYTGIGVICSYLSSLLFFATPWAAPVSEALLPLLSDAAALEDPTLLQQAMTSAMLDAVVPLMILFGIVFVCFAAPAFYHYRMASFALMDAPEQGALAALRSSRRLCRRNCIALFRLDLSFWWFYLLELFVSVLCYTDLILGWLGITLPFSASTAYFLFLGLYLVSQLALYLWRKNLVQVTYAHAYDALRNAPVFQQPAPQNQPWNYG